MTDEQAATEMMRKQLSALVLQLRSIVPAAQAALAQSEGLLTMLQPPAPSEQPNSSTAYFGSDD